MTTEGDIQELLDRETAAWDARDAEQLVSLFKAAQGKEERPEARASRVETPGPSTRRVAAQGIRAAWGGASMHKIKPRALEMLFRHLPRPS